MSYGATVADAVHQAGIYAGKILSGDKEADLPVIEVENGPLPAVSTMSYWPLSLTDSVRRLLSTPSSTQPSFVTMPPAR